MTATTPQDRARRVEAHAAAHPRLYRLQVVLFGALGYGYLALVLIGALLLFALIVWVLAQVHGSGGVFIAKLGLPLLILIWVILRALWVRITPPEGMPVPVESGGELVAEVQRVRRAVQGPRVHQVLLTDDLNAAVSQVPRLGLFGWPRNYVLIGLPLLAALSPEQFRAVLAHEFGHLSRAHGRASAWALRVTATWFRLVQELGRRRHRASFLFLRFFQWYLPRFHAYASVLARQREREADADAAAAFGADALAAALLRLDVYARLLDRRFWKGVSDEVRLRETPPEDVFSRMVAALRVGPEPAEARGWTAEALARGPAEHDSHPPLAERLRAIGYGLPAEAVEATAALAQLAGGIEESAADRLLGAQAAAAVAQRQDRAWHEAAAGRWHEARRADEEEAQRLAELAARPAAELDEGEAVDRLVLTCQRVSPEAALALAAQEPGLARHPASRLFLGRIRLEQGDESAQPEVEAVAAEGPYLAPPAFAALAAFRQARGDDEGAAAFGARASEAAAFVARMEEERKAAQLGPRDTYLPHDLDEATLAAVRRAILSVHGVERVYLVRKQVRLWPEQPLFVVGVEGNLRRGRQGEDRYGGVHEVLRALSLPGSIIVVPFAGRWKGLRRRFRRVPGAEVFPLAASHVRPPPAMSGGQ